MSLGRGDAEDFVIRMRDHFIAQFKAFIDEQKRNCVVGASELKLSLDEAADVFQGLYCIDFITNDGEYRVLRLESEGLPLMNPLIF
jgi:hypothetical protein